MNRLLVTLALALLHTIGPARAESMDELAGFHARPPAAPCCGATHLTRLTLQPIRSNLEVFLARPPSEALSPSLCFSDATSCHLIAQPADLLGVLDIEKALECSASATDVWHSAAMVENIDRYSTWGDNALQVAPRGVSSRFVGCFPLDESLWSSLGDSAPRLGCSAAQDRTVVAMPCVYLDLEASVWILTVRFSQNALEVRTERTGLRLEQGRLTPDQPPYRSR